MKRMNWKMAMLLVVLGGLATALPAQADLIWSDGFESGDFLGGIPSWDIPTGLWNVPSDSLGRSDSRRALVRAESSQGGDILTVQISSVGYENLTWEYWHWTAQSYPLEAGDHIYVEWTADGTTWELLVDYNDTNDNVHVSTDPDRFAEASFDLPLSADNNPNLGFRLRADLKKVPSSDNDSMSFDDFKLSGTPVPEPTMVAFLGIGGVVMTMVRRRRFRCGY